MSEYLTAIDLGRRLQLSPETIRQMARDGRIPAIRISPKIIRFDASAVNAALTRQPEAIGREADSAS
jgi:excisionase family DNA binding protein